MADLRHLKNRLSAGFLRNVMGFRRKERPLEILGSNCQSTVDASKREKNWIMSKASGLLFDDFRGGKIGRVTLEWAEQEKSE